MNGIRISSKLALALAGLGFAGADGAVHTGRAAAAGQRGNVVGNVHGSYAPGNAGAPSADSPTSFAVSERPTIRVEQTIAGKILTNGSGFTLYTFTRDRRNHDNCARVPRCLNVWPALTTTRRPVAGPHLRSSLIGTITLHGGIKQVTYAGHPLYTYAHDFSPRSTLYIGAYEYGGYWNALTAAGRPTP
jgi:predicted lipoprotein with Yx(FWY)xxD motif